jgi:phage regulator Rha-like protein
LVPLFHVEYEDPTGDELANGESQSRRTNLAHSFRRMREYWQLKSSASKANIGTNGAPGQTRPKICGIGYNMTSIFVTMPTGKTVITFNKQKTKKVDELESEDHHHTQSTDSWSRVKDDLEKSYSKLRQYDGQYLCYSLLYQAVDVIGPVVKEIRHGINDEKRTLRDLKYRNMRRIHILRDALKSMARKLKPVRNLLVHVIEDKTISPGP